MFLSLWGLSHSGVLGQGAGGDLPIRLFPLSAFGLPCLRSGGGGQVRQCLGAHPFFGTVAWCLFKTLLFPSYTTRCRYDVPSMLASGSGLAASASSCACGRCLRIALGPCAGFPFVSLPCGRVVLMGQHLVFVSLSTGWMCFIHSVPVGFSRFCVVSIGELAFLPPLDLSLFLSDPVAPSLEETFEVPMWVGSSSSLHGLSSV